MSSATPLVSIVIPAYNHARYLDEAIQSVLTQDYPRVELIVLDDGSTDSTHDVLGKYSGKFFWESQLNMGQAETLNKGWRLSKGEVLAYLSADDVLKPRAVSSSVKALTANPQVVLTYCDFNLIDPHSAVVRRVNTPDFNYRDMVVRLSCPPGPGAFFRRSAFDAAGLWDSSLKQMPDYDYWLRLSLQGTFLRIPEVLAGFRIHEESQTFSQTSVERAEEPVKIVHGLFDNRTLPAEISCLREQALSNAHLVSGQLHFRAGRYRLGYAHLRQAASLHLPNFFTASTVRVLFNALFNRLGHRLVWKINELRQK